MNTSIEENAIFSSIHGKPQQLQGRLGHLYYRWRAERKSPFTTADVYNCLFTKSFSTRVKNC